jgi:hypothetical protein
MGLDEEWLLDRFRRANADRDTGEDDRRAWMKNGFWIV